MTKYLLVLAFALSASTSFAKTDLNAKQALEALLEGNKRFMKELSIHPNRTKEHRDSVLNKQMPFAAILTCSDSRVAPEIIFDQGVGDLFVVRNAGNVVGAIAQDSLDFAAIGLHVPLIVVMGHENCGAVKAVLEGNTKDIYWVAKEIKPAIKKIDPKAPSALESAVVANVQWVVNKIKRDRTIFPLVLSNKLEVVGAYYDFNTSEVKILPF